MAISEPAEPAKRTPPPDSREVTVLDQDASPYVLPDLAYDPGSLEPHLSGRVVALHHGAHHAAYVHGANRTLEHLAGARDSGDFGRITMLEKDLAFHVSGHVLHSLQWTNLSPDGGGEPEGALGEAIGDAFGGIEGFRSQMAQAAVTVQGSGWAAASWEPYAGRIVIHQIYDHQDNHSQGSIPLLVVDAWEHAYYLQYENRRADYVDAIWNVIDWRDVARRYEAARVVTLAPS